ncbi:TrmB family transcriptional regulator [Patescibacteria group bacterium]
MIKQIKNYLRELGFTANEIKVYIALTKLGEAKAVEIAKKVELPRTTVISILNKLSNENYLTTNKYKGTTYYWIESPKTISTNLESKIAIADQLNSLLTGLYRTEAQFPAAQIYDSKTSIKQFIIKTLSNLPKKSIYFTIDSPGAANYAKIYSDHIRKILYQQKKKRGIVTKTLIPYGSFKQILPFKLKDQLIQIRELPQGIDVSSSLWIIEDKIIHFSGNPPFLVVLKHEKIVQSQKSLYTFLWELSTPKN